MKDDIAVVLSQLLGSFEKVPTYISLCMSWDKHLKDTELSRQSFRAFLVVKSHEFITAINLDYLTSIAQKLQIQIHKLPDLTFEEMRLKNQCPGLEEVSRAITKIYQNIQVLVGYSEECMHYIGVFKHAINYLECWKKSVNELVMDEDVCTLCFSNQTDRKKFSSRMTSDIEAHISVLKIHQRVLSDIIEKTLRTRQNMLLRADSALRLLTKLAEMENASGWVSGDTEPPHKPTDISNFNVETL